MNPGDKKTLIIARRTRKNLNFIYAQKEKGENVEEFTQLINSMLGMLICLREEYFRDRTVTWKDVEKHGLHPIQIRDNDSTNISPNLNPSKTFSKLITNLRHASSHNCFELIGNPIKEVEIWNIPLRKKNTPQNRVWQAKLTEKQLKQIAELLFDFLEIEHGSDLKEDTTL